MKKKRAQEHILRGRTPPIRSDKTASVYAIIFFSNVVIYSYISIFMQPVTNTISEKSKSPEV